MQASEGEGAVEASQSGAPFKPSAYPKWGPNATFEKFPEYLHDPEVPKIEARVAAVKAEREAVASRGFWRPGGGRKTDATRSIVRMNL